MTLAIIHNGEVHEVTTDVEEFDFERPFAQAMLAHAIMKTVNRVKETESAANH